MLKRKTPLRANPEKTRAWKERSRQELKKTPFKKKHYEFKQVSRQRESDNAIYSILRVKFLEEHPICPVTGKATTQIHHSAKRQGGWQNLQRYWIAVSLEGHAWIEENKREAETRRLMVRIMETFKVHVDRLKADGISLTEPIYYSK